MSTSPASRVAVVGSGYVGTVVAACLAFLGNDVVGVESDRSKLSLLRRGRAHFFEPGLNELLADGLRSGRLAFTDAMEIAVPQADFVFLCVGTPSDADGRTDSRALETAIRGIAAEIAPHAVIVTKSTAPVGTAQWLGAVLEDAAEDDDEIPAVVANPEFLREASAIEDFLHPDRVVLGADDARAVDSVAELYRPILEQAFPGGRAARRPPLIRTSARTAETIKYAANAFLATKVSFINEIANICELLGVDVTEVAATLGLDHRIGPHFLGAGAGWGGSCFGKDLRSFTATARDAGYEPQLLQATADVNERQPGVVVGKLQRSLGVMRGRRIGILGLAFKAGTDDLRDSPALAVAADLLRAGALVRAHDPAVLRVPDLPDLEVLDDPYEVADRADAVVLATDWEEYVGLDLDLVAKRMRGNLLVDGRNLFDRRSVEAAGLGYDCIGRGETSPEDAGQRMVPSSGRTTGSFHGDPD